MIASLAKFIDWLFIQNTCMRMPPIDGRTLRLEEALQFLKGPDFIPAESQPARVEFNPNQSGLLFRCGPGGPRRRRASRRSANRACSCWELKERTVRRSLRGRAEKQTMSRP